MRQHCFRELPVVLADFVRKTHLLISYAGLIDNADCEEGIPPLSGIRLEEVPTPILISIVPEQVEVDRVKLNTEGLAYRS